MLKKVVLIDDDVLFRAGLARLIDSFDGFKVEVECGSTDFLALTKRRKKRLNPKDFNLVIVCPPMYSKGVRFIEKIANYMKGTSIMIFSNVFSKNSLMKALECGISAYYTKGISPFDLEDIMVEITEQENFSDIKLEFKIKNILLKEDPVIVDFTEAEEDVLRLVCDQKNSAEISDDLGISVRTVESRKRNMMQKTHSRNMIGVVMLYLKISPSEFGGSRH